MLGAATRLNRIVVVEPHHHPSSLIMRIGNRQRLNLSKRMRETQARKAHLI